MPRARWIDPDAWERLAACREHDASLFFGPLVEPRGDRDRREAAAKAVCATCVVVVPCRERSLADGEVYGVWGGLGEAERRALLVRRGAADSRAG